MEAAPQEAGDAPDDRAVLWDEERTAKRLGMTTAWLQADRSRRKLQLPFVKIGRAVRYRPEDVEAFIKRNLKTSG